MTLLAAAELAFALIRFEMGAAHLRQSYTPPGSPILGVDSFLFWPDNRRILAAEVPRYLSGFSSPALLAPTTSRGIVTHVLVEELTPPRDSSARHHIANAATHLAEAARHLQIESSARVVLEFDDESHVFSFDTLRLCMAHFVVLIAWNLQPLQYRDSRATARLMLLRSDGVSSWGGACPLPPAQ